MCSSGIFTCLCLSLKQFYTESLLLQSKWPWKTSFLKFWTADFSRWQHKWIISIAGTQCFKALCYMSKLLSLQLRYVSTALLTCDAVMEMKEDLSVWCFHAGKGSALLRKLFHQSFSMYLKTMTCVENWEEPLLCQASQQAVWTWSHSTTLQMALIVLKTEFLRLKMKAVVWPRKLWRLTHLLVILSLRMSTIRLSCFERDILQAYHGRHASVLWFKVTQAIAVLKQSNLPILTWKYLRPIIRRSF